MSSIDDVKAPGMSEPGPSDADHSFATDGGPAPGDAGASTEGGTATDAGETTCEPAEFQLWFNTPDPSRAVFDPNEITIAGTLSQGTCGSEVVAPWNEPNRALAGFGCRVSARAIRSDGRMLYLDGDTQQVRVFACDDCTYVHPQDRYRLDYASNDAVVPTPGCDGANPPAYFLLSPEGSMIHRCGSFTTWYNESGQVVFSGAYVLSYGVDGWLLAADDRLVSARTGASVRIQGLPADANLLAYRATASGFWIAAAATGTYDPIALWHVTFDGVGSQLGTYPIAPASANSSFSTSDGSGLDADGRFYQIVSSKDHPMYDVLVRRTLNGSSEIIYDEITNPILRVHIPALVSGSGARDDSKRHAWGGNITTPHCPSHAELWTYMSLASPVQPLPVVVPIPSPQPGPGVACGTTRCAGRDEVCCGPSRSDTTGPLSCKLHRNRAVPGNFDQTCSIADPFAACDQSSDCVTPDDDPDDPAVCCFASSNGSPSRECTTARVCAGSAKRTSAVNGSTFTGVLACQQDTDCALAAQPSRCVNDGVITGSPLTNPQVGRCEGTVIPPDGTTLLASSLRCAETICSHEAGRGCCHTGTLQVNSNLNHGVLSMESPSCQAACSTNNVAGRYAAHSYCDDPSDCNDPAAAQPADPFECCFTESTWGGPWDRECKLRSTCRFFACQNESDCDRILPELTCRPERTLTGGGKKRPEVRSCQTP